MAATFGPREVARLLKVYASPAIAQQRARTLAALGVRPGERGLDVGCGPGFLTAELAAAVGERGRVVGLDASPEMREAVTRLRDEASQAGRNPQDITISFRAPIAFANDSGTSRQPLTGSPAAIQDDIGRYADCGVSHMVFDVMTPDVTEMQRVMERFAHDVKTGVRA